jgi:hypothetical protein
MSLAIADRDRRETPIQGREFAAFLGAERPQRGICDLPRGEQFFAMDMEAIADADVAGPELVGREQLEVGQESDGLAGRTHRMGVFRIADGSLQVRSQLVYRSPILFPLRVRTMSAPRRG